VHAGEGGHEQAPHVQLVAEQMALPYVLHVSVEFAAHTP
jgi:hypothetical protein